MMFDLVKKFHKTLNLFAPEDFTPMTESVIQRRCNLIVEEMTETVEALGALRHDNSLEAHLHLMKELCDLIFVVLGTAVEMGLNLDPYFLEVSRSNLSKVGGKIRKSDGKLMKPDTYSPADMEAVYHGEQDI